MDILVNPSSNRMDFDLAQAKAVQYAKVFQKIIETNGKDPQ
jgi:hypothetical protein